jgi:hypothetical protein
MEVSSQGKRSYQRKASKTPNAVNITNNTMPKRFAITITDTAKARDVSALIQTLESRITDQNPTKVAV